jgi:hypothetical protein
MKHGTPIPSFRVASRHRFPRLNCRACWTYDYAGSIASAMRLLRKRVAAGLYSEVFVQRVCVTKGRGRRTRRFLCEHRPVMRWPDSASRALRKAA